MKLDLQAIDVDYIKDSASPYKIMRKRYSGSLANLRHHVFIFETLILH